MRQAGQKRRAEGPPPEAAAAAAPLAGGAPIYVAAPPVWGSPTAQAAPMEAAEGAAAGDSLPGTPRPQVSFRRHQLASLPNLCSQLHPTSSPVIHDSRPAGRGLWHIAARQPAVPAGSRGGCCRAPAGGLAADPAAALPAAPAAGSAHPAAAAAPRSGGSARRRGRGCQRQQAVRRRAHLPPRCLQWRYTRQQQPSSQLAPDAYPGGLAGHMTHAACSYRDMPPIGCPSKPSRIALLLIRQTQASRHLLPINPQSCCSCRPAHVWSWPVWRLKP